MKIKVCAGWESTELITKRLLKQFKTPYIDLSNIEFVYDDSYDLIVFNNYVNEEIKEGKKAAIFFHEPSWAGTHQKGFSNYKEDILIFGFDRDEYVSNGNIIETPAHTFYGGRGPWVDLLDDWCYDKVSDYEKVEKTNNISSIVTTLNEERGGTCLYSDRYSLIKNIIKDLDFIDYYGGWSKDSDNVKNEPQKIKATLPYKFSLVIENEYHKNWITEKFYDPIICNTIPIYYGCSNIKEIYPENGYILLDNITDHEYVRQKLIWINENSDSIYREMYPELLKIKERYFRDYNLLDKIVNL